MSVASIMVGPGHLEQVDDLVVEPPGPGEVSVRVHWCSACHSDLHAFDGLTPPPLPSVLGHEAAGVVERVGDGVEDLAVGDRVVLSMIGPCGTCTNCLRGAPIACLRSTGRGGVMADGSTRLSRDGQQVSRALRVGGFSDITVVQQAAAVRLPADIGLDVASILGCSVQTGYGAIVNIADVRPGGTVGVIGLGAVGIATVQMARIAGATHVVGIDPLESRRALAASLGATVTFAPDEATPQTVADAVGTGLLDAVVDTVTRAATTRQAVDLLGHKGVAVLVGVSGPGEPLGVGAADLVLSQKRLAGCYLGDCVPQRDIPVMIDLWRQGQLDLDAMVTSRRPLSELELAFADLREGTGLRTALQVYQPAPATGISR